MLMPEQSHLRLQVEGERGKDLFLCHTGADKPWVEQLAERVEAETYQNRLLGVVFDKWDFAKGSNIVVDIEKEIDACRYIGVVVTRALLNADWPTLERSIAVWSDPSGARGRVISASARNVTLPALAAYQELGSTSATIVALRNASGSSSTFCGGKRRRAVEAACSRQCRK